MDEAAFILNKYLEVTERAIACESWERILPFLEKRERLLREVAGVMPKDRQLDNGGEVNRLLLRIKAQEEALQKKLRLLRDEAKEKLAAISHGKKLRAQYQHAYVQNDGIFYDKRK
jgi:hypothetical protein